MCGGVYSLLSVFILQGIFYEMAANSTLTFLWRQGEDFWRWFGEDDVDLGEGVGGDGEDGEEREVSV